MSTSHCKYEVEYLNVRQKHIPSLYLINSNYASTIYKSLRFYPIICTSCRSLICLKLTVRQPVLSQAVRWAAWVVGQLAVGQQDGSSILENGTWNHFWVITCNYNIWEVYTVYYHTGLSKTRCHIGNTVFAGTLQGMLRMFCAFFGQLEPWLRGPTERGHGIFNLSHFCGWTSCMESSQNGGSPKWMAYKRKFH